MYKIIYVAKCVTNLLENPQKKSKLDQSNESNKTKIVEAVNSNLIQGVQIIKVILNFENKYKINKRAHL